MEAGGEGRGMLLELCRGQCMFMFVKKGSSREG